MILLVCWIVFPALLLLITHGCGALVEGLGGVRMSPGVRIPCGAALVMGVMDLATRSASTARLAVPAVLVLAAIGILVFSPPWRWGRRLDLGLVAGLLVLAAYAAPVVMSGGPTWAGYIKLDDTATWLALVDRALEHGHSVAGLPPSSYLATLDVYLASSYPLGGMLPLGIGHVVLGQDNAFLFDPWMAFMAATLALALQRIARLALGAGASGWKSVVIAFLAAQSALLYGYYLWGGIKEMAAATLTAAFAVAAPLALDCAPSRSAGSTALPASLPLAERVRVRAMLPAAVVLWGLVAALSPGGLVYAGPGLVLALLLWAAIGLLARRRRGPGAAAAMPPAGAASTATREEAGARRAFPVAPARWAVVLVPLAAGALGAWLILRPGGFVQQFKGALTGESLLGNLIAPLRLEHLAGVWIGGDFRFPPDLPVLTHVLEILIVILAAIGLLLAVREGRRALVLYLFCALAGGLLVALVGAPWVAGKALATASPALPLAALCALAWPGGLRRLGRPSGSRVSAESLFRGVAAVAGVAIAGGILWSNLLGYHDANLAPSVQFQELAEIGTRIKGRGPTLMTEFQPYGARHFLREAAGESASELRIRDVPLIDGSILQRGESADVDQIQLPALMIYRTLVLQRSPVGSRPPAAFRLLFADRFWEVWQRPAHPGADALWHLPLGDASHPGSVPDCPTLMALARKPGVKRLVAEPAVNPRVISLARSIHPARWATEYNALAPSGSGRASLTVDLKRSGDYSAWLGGSNKGPLTIEIDGRIVGEALQEIQEPGQYLPFGTIRLRAGRHTVVLRYGGGLWRPGVGGPPEFVGPLVLRREGPSRPRRGGSALSRASLISLPARRAPALCGRTLDWVEGIG